MPMWALGCVFALVSVPFLWIVWRVVARDRAIRSWPRAPGVIAASYVETSNEQHRDEDGHYRAYTTHRPHVRYTYSVGGASLEGESVAPSLDGSTVGERAAQAIIDAYPTGRDVMVLYDPSDPKKAHLEVRRSLGAMILLGFGALWLALGALFIALSVLA